MIPTANDVVFCEEALVDARGNAILDMQGQPELCGNIMTSSLEPFRSRLGFRWRCGGVQFLPGSNIRDLNRRHSAKKVNPQKNTIFEHSHIEYRSFLRCLFALFKNRGFVGTIEVMDTSSRTTSGYMKTLREALAVCGWHDQDKIGNRSILHLVVHGHELCPKYRWP